METLFYIDNRKFLEAVEKVIPVVPSKSTLPILRDLLLNYNGETLQITGCNQDTYIRVQITDMQSKDDSVPGDFCINGEYLYDFLKSFQSEELLFEFSVKERRLIIKDVNEFYNFNYPVIPGEEYPKTPFDYAKGYEYNKFFLQQNTLRAIAEKFPLIGSIDEFYAPYVRMRLDKDYAHMQYAMRYGAIVMSADIAYEDNLYTKKYMDFAFNPDVIPHLKVLGGFKIKVQLTGKDKPEGILFEAEDIILFTNCVPVRTDRPFLHINHEGRIHVNVSTADLKRAYKAVTATTTGSIIEGRNLMLFGESNKIKFVLFENNTLDKLIEFTVSCEADSEFMTFTNFENLKKVTQIFTETETIRFSFPRENGFYEFISPDSEVEIQLPRHRKPEALPEVSIEEDLFSEVAA